MQIVYPEIQFPNLRKVKIIFLILQLFYYKTMIFKAAQQRDRDIKELIYAVNNPDDANIPIGIRRRAKNFRILDGILYKRNADFVGNE